MSVVFVVVRLHGRHYIKCHEKPKIGLTENKCLKWLLRQCTHSQTKTICSLFAGKGSSWVKHLKSFNVLNHKIWNNAYWNNKVQSSTPTIVHCILFLFIRGTQSWLRFPAPFQNDNCKKKYRLWHRRLLIKINILDNSWSHKDTWSCLTLVCDNCINRVNIFYWVADL